MGVRLNKHLTNVPGFGEKAKVNDYALDPTFRKLEIALIAALAFSPDREWGPIYREYKDQLDKLDDVFPKLIASLEACFFDELYTPRPVEEAKLRAALPAGELILISGLIGEGKSCLLRQFIRTHSQAGAYDFLYLDMRLHTRPLEKIGEASFGGMHFDFRPIEDDDRSMAFELEFSSYLFKRVKEHLENTQGLDSRKWYAHLLRSEPRLSSLFDRLRIASRLPLRSDEDIASAMDADSQLALIVMNRVDELEVLSVQSLFGWISACGMPFVLCIDNLDRYPPHRQRQVRSLCIDWAQHDKVDVIVSLREKNYRRFGDWTSKSDPICKIEMTPLLDRPKWGSGDYTPGDRLDENVVLQMVRSRLDMLHRFAPDVLPSVRIEDGRDEGETFRLSFLELCDRLVDGLLGIGHYELSNRGLRELLPYFGRSILAIMFGAEREYIQGILGVAVDSTGTVVIKREPDRNRRNSFLLKWLMGGGACVPTFGSVVPNILAVEPLTLPESQGLSITPPIALEAMVLEHLVRISEPMKGNMHGAPINVVREEFEHYGIDGERLRASLDRLKNAKLHGHLGHVEIHYTYEFDEATCTSYPLTTVELLPSGRWLVERLFPTCEYVFWAALDSPLSEEEEGSLDMSNVTLDYLDWFDNDDRKVGFVTRYLERVLIPRYRRLIAASNEVPQLEGVMRQFLDNTSVRGIPFPLRLESSMHRHIEYIDATSSRRTQLHDRLIKAVDEFRVLWEGLQPRAA